MYDAIIIGAGPAGLMAGYILGKNNLSYIVIEQGSDYLERKSSRPYDVSYGFGGAGLFSDGKFSYPPAASKLWTVRDSRLLENAYNNFYELLSSLNIDVLPWNCDWIVQCSNRERMDGEKHYKHIRIGDDERYKILDYFHKVILDSNKVRLGSKVLNIRRVESGFKVECEDSIEYQGLNVIIASGKRSSSNMLRDIENIRYRKYCEVGVRVECENRYFTYKDKKEDLKNITNIDDNTDVRTFCTCWQGRVVESFYDDKHITYNGETVVGYSKTNIGIVVKSSNVKSILYRNGVDVYKTLNPNKIDLTEYRSGKKFLGLPLDNEIRKYLNVLLTSDAVGLVYGPEIEKYGKYPIPDTNLQIAPGVYVVGDGTALFRGLVAAFVSGAYVALKIKKDEDFKQIIEDLGVKTSPIESMIIVFTAHSKTSFYAKNIICEHVFKNNAIPINPYRSFGYFLDDRVERNLVRQANNQMVIKCDELWVYGRISDGVLFEIVNALKFNKPIRFFTIGTHINDIREIKIDDLKFEPEVHAKHIRKTDIQEFIKRGLSYIKKE
ncbi:MAG: hypothetical protein Q4E64_09320 [Phascolarctobacterium sp.]|uniref:DUF7768 domain-containing protein n=1 Tax=Phascolarctobacterium sp. TaxID=2049039 RepID=UPI0026DA86B1|nr:hypothetical protein [Phascolarctobacterium sp.]MDO4922007.1 hypothetical protein [Phascolarctobacterium sp.]